MVNPTSQAKNPDPEDWASPGQGITGAGSELSPQEALKLNPRAGVSSDGVMEWWKME